MKEISPVEGWFDNLPIFEIHECFFHKDGAVLTTSIGKLYIESSCEDMKFLRPKETLTGTIISMGIAKSTGQKELRLYTAKHIWRLKWRVSCDSPVNVFLIAKCVF